MTKKRILVGGATLALTLGLGAGIAAAQTDPTPPTRPPEAGTTMHDGDMGNMGAMHAQMPDEMRAQCETIHVRGGAMDHDQMMNGRMGSGMMNDRMSAQS